MGERYRIIQDGQPVAWADRACDIAHYALVYGQDGPVEIQARVNGRWRAMPKEGGQRERTLPTT